VIRDATWFVHFADPSGAGDPPPLRGNLVAHALVRFQYESEATNRRPRGPAVCDDGACPAR
jgi:hypothetical protein